MASRTFSNGALLQMAAAFLVFSHVTAMDNLNVAFEWKQLDFAYPSESEKQEAKDNGEFIPENNLPVGLEVFEERLFVTVPKLKNGVPVTLAYVSLANMTNTSPELIPYPNWSAHKALAGEVSELISPYRVRADRCGRLWVLDTGMVDILNNSTVIAPPQLVVYDLRTDNIMRTFTIPQDHIEPKSFFANIAIEDTSCEDCYAYVADIGAPGLVVYSWRTAESWRIKHHFFHPDPVSGDFNVTGINFQSNDAVLGLALSSPGSDGFSTLYFHPLASTNEFSVSTKILRNSTLAAESFTEFTMLGNRGPNAQSSVEFVDKNTGVLFYGLVNLNAVACWKTTNKAYTIESQGRIYMSNTTMVYPNDLKVDDKGNLWVLSDKLPSFQYGKLNPEEVNFRILTASVKDAIRGTTCDTNISIDLINRFNDVKTSIDKIKDDISSGAGVLIIPTLSFILVQTFMVLFSVQMH